MSDTHLLDLAVEAHGGQTRWDEVSRPSSSTFRSPARSGTPRVSPTCSKDVVMTVDTRQQRVLTTFVGQDRQTVFEPGQVVICRQDGHTEETRKDPDQWNQSLVM